MKLHDHEGTPPRSSGSRYTRPEEVVYNALALVAALAAVMAVCALLLLVWP